MKYSQTDKIENYLQGKLPPDEARQFEEQVQSDTELSQELSFQKEIITGIENYRRAQLKTRLANIEVSPVSVQSMGTNVLGVVTISAALLAGGWYFFNANAEEKSGPLISMEGPSHDYMDHLQLPEIVEYEEAVIEKFPITSQDEVATRTEDNEKAIVPTFPSISVPSAGNLSEDILTVDTAEEKIETFETSATSNQALEVKMHELEDKVLKYTYYDGKLSLYGQFRGNPYQIIEINSDGGKRVFLYFSDAYYFISPTSEVSEMSRVNEQKLIEELNIFLEAK